MSPRHPKQSPSLEVLIDRFVQRMQVKNYASSTIKLRREYLRRFTRWSDDRGITRIGRDHPRRAAVVSALPVPPPGPSHQPAAQVQHADHAADPGDRPGRRYSQVPKSLQGQCRNEERPRHLRKRCLPPFGPRRSSGSNGGRVRAASDRYYATGRPPGRDPRPSI